MIFTKTAVNRFRHNHQAVPGLRMGQMFYEYFRLHVSNDPLCDKIYNVKDEDFWKLIDKHTDWDQ